MSWKNLFGLRTQTIATPDEEDALYAVMNTYEPAGEDESYHRLMGLIADDLRAQRWAVAPKRNWLPVASLTATAAILAFLAYNVGSWHGAGTARENYESQMAHNNATAPTVGESLPPSAPGATTAQLEPPVTGPSAPVASPRGEILAMVPNENLNQDQKDTLSVVVKALDEDQWADAAKNLVRLADTARGSDLEIYSLHAASELYSQRLADSTSAMDLLRREQTVIIGQLGAPQDAERRERLLSQQRVVESRLAEMASEPPTTPN